MIHCDVFIFLYKSKIDERQQKIKQFSLITPPIITA
jgi:hypothetical protein